jgi:modulator of FtsH protease HflC
MKRTPITFVTAGLLALIFALMLFTFQVRLTETAVVTTFGQYSRSITNAGFNLRLPWPIQKVYKFDNRVQNFERMFEQTTTRDAITILITVYAGWRVVEPRLFLESLNGDFLKAEQSLEPLVRNAKTGVISQHPFSDLVSTNVATIKFDQIEKEMLASIQGAARSTYGIEVSLLGIKQLGLPESVTAKVFDRMKAERQTLVKKFQTEGDREARILRAQADSEAKRILADAQAQAIKIEGEAEAKAAEYYRVMQRNPDLANFIFQRNALEQSTREKTTLILDQQTPPFNMLSGQGATAVQPETKK